LRKPYFLLLTLPLVLASCASVVEFKVEHPPLVDLRSVNTITVIPFEWNKAGLYSNLASDATKALTAGIKSSGKYTFVNPAALRELDPKEYREYVDVYVTGKIIDVSSDDREETREEKDGDKTITKVYVTRTVTVDIEYKYIRSSNNEVLGVFTKTEIHSVTFDNSKRSEKWWKNLLLDIFIPQGESTDKLAKTAIAMFSGEMEHEIAPWTGTEKRHIAESTGKDKRFKQAQKLVRQRDYFSALALYKTIFEETGSAVAGYNTAVLLQANGQFDDALSLLEKLDEGILKTGISSPPFIMEEIENLKKLIKEFELLEDYKSSPEPILEPL